MSIFGKKSESKSPQQEQQEEATQELDLDPDESGARTAASSRYGIADAMLLLRSLPLDQHLDLVVPVVRVPPSAVSVRTENTDEAAPRPPGVPGAPSTRPARVSGRSTPTAR